MYKYMNTHIYTHGIYIHILIYDTRRLKATITSHTKEHAYNSQRKKAAYCIV